MLSEEKKAAVEEVFELLKNGKVGTDEEVASLKKELNELLDKHGLNQETLNDILMASKDAIKRSDREVFDETKASE